MTLTEIDPDPLINLLTGSFGGLAAAWLMVWWGRDENKRQREENKRLMESVTESHSARILNVEQGQAACEARYNLILSHVLGLKGVGNGH